MLFVGFSVDKNGDVCISILHEPGEDKYGYEKPEERWLPIHTVETIMISVISMLADPNGDSPANVDAAVSPPMPPRRRVFNHHTKQAVRQSARLSFNRRVDLLSSAERVEGGQRWRIQKESCPLCTEKPRRLMQSKGLASYFQGKTS